MKLRGLITILAITLALAGCDRQKTPAATVSVILPEAKDVTTESRVTYRGLEVGRVSETRIVDGGIEVVMAITRDDLRLRKGDQARTYIPALLSNVSNVEIVPGPSDAALLQSGEKLTAAPPGPTVSAKDLVDALRAAATAPSTQPATRP
jgi:ABC-type transporter Mla subunit MlaD